MRADPAKITTTWLWSILDVGGAVAGGLDVKGGTGQHKLWDQPQDARDVASRRWENTDGTDWELGGCCVPWRFRCLRYHVDVSRPWRQWHSLECKGYTEELEWIRNAVGERVATYYLEVQCSTMDYLKHEFFNPESVRAMSPWEKFQYSPDLIVMRFLCARSLLSAIWHDSEFCKAMDAYGKHGQMYSWTSLNVWTYSDFCHSRASVEILLSTPLLYYLAEVHILWKKILLVLDHLLGSWNRGC